MLAIQPTKEESMTENSSLDLLKNTILLEKRGKAFYRTAANQSTNDLILHLSSGQCVCTIAAPLDQFIESELKPWLLVNAAMHCDK
jgi:hypothetical protein